MILDFCCVCGKKEDLHQHHIVPRIISSQFEEYRNNNETITLCAHHHDMIHTVQRNRWDNHGNMIKLGIKKRKSQGLPVGRKSSRTPEMDEKIKSMILNNIGVRETMKTLNIGTKYYYSIFDTIHKRNTIPPGRKAIKTPEKDKMIIDLYNQGTSARQIMRTLKVGTKHYYSIVKELRK